MENKKVFRYAKWMFMEYLKESGFIKIFLTKKNVINTKKQE
jgi:hypothetical protein